MTEILDREGCEFRTSPRRPLRLELLNDVIYGFTLDGFVLRRGSFPREVLRRREALVELLENVEVVALRQIRAEFLAEISDLNRGGVGHDAPLEECGRGFVVCQGHVGLELAPLEIPGPLDCRRGSGEIFGFGRQRGNVVLELFDLRREPGFDLLGGVVEGRFVEVVGLFVLGREGFLLEQGYEVRPEMFG